MFDTPSFDDSLAFNSGAWGSDGFDSGIHGASSQHHQQSVFGTPEADAAGFVHQTTSFTCAVVSQQMVLQGFGIPIGEAELVYEATANGWLTSGGTTIENLGRLLEYHGVPVHEQFGGDRR